MLKEEWTWPHPSSKESTEEPREVGEIYKARSDVDENTHFAWVWVCVRGLCWKSEPSLNALSYISLYCHDLPRCPGPICDLNISYLKQNRLGFMAAQAYFVGSCASTAMLQEPDDESSGSNDPKHSSPITIPFWVKDYTSNCRGILKLYRDPDFWCKVSSYPSLKYQGFPKPQASAVPEPEEYPCDSMGGVNEFGIPRRSGLPVCWRVPI